MGKFPLITSAFLNLTDECSCRCTYCFVDQHPNFMSYQTAKDAADFLAKNAKESGTSPSIVFFGGEPLLMYDKIIKPLTEYIRAEYGDSFGLSITSNCVDLDEKKSDFMVKNGIGLLFSIDGDKYSQNINRPLKDGGESFKILYPKIPMILDHFPNVTFRGTITPATAEYLFHNIMFAEECGFRNTFFMPNFFEPWSDDKIKSLRKQMRLYSDHYIDCLSTGKEPIYFNQLEKQFKKILLHNFEVRNNTVRNDLSCKACGKCGLGSGSAAGININGDITACQEFFSKERNIFTIGNIYTGVDDSLRKNLIDLFDSTPSSSSRCSTCKLKRICDGGCVANNYMATGDMNKVPEISCIWHELLFTEAIYIMNTLGKQKNERFKSRWEMYV